MDRFNIRHVTWTIGLGGRSFRRRWRDWKIPENRCAGLRWRLVRVHGARDHPRLDDHSVKERGGQQVVAYWPGEAKGPTSVGKK